MSRVTRITLAAFVSLGVIIGIYTSVNGASLSDQQGGVGTRLVTRSTIDLDQHRSPETYVAPAPVQSEQKGTGHGCESDFQTSPDD